MANMDTIDQSDSYLTCNLISANLEPPVSDVQKTKDWSAVRNWSDKDQCKFDSNTIQNLTVTPLLIGAA